MTDPTEAKPRASACTHGWPDIRDCGICWPSRPFATGTARNVTLRCGKGHEWQSAETRTQGLYNMIATSYLPGACPECHGEPVAIEGRE